MSPYLGASSSSQSTTTRIGILISLYLLILICFPYARSLVSVHRRPIDDKAIALWQRRQERACPVTLPALASVQGVEVGGGDEAWTAQLDGRVGELLQRATDAQHGEERWCLKWDVQSSGGGSSAASRADFVYTVGSSAAPSSSSATPLSLPRNISSFSPDSVALVLARRIALDLDLPAKHLLIDVEAESPTGIEDVNQAAAVDPQPEGEAPLAEVQTHAPSAPPQRNAAEYAALPAISLPDDEEVLRRLKEQSTVSTGASSPSSEVSIPLPPRLILSLHVLNEDLPSIIPTHTHTSANTSNYLLSPLTSHHDFTSALQNELADVHTALDGVTRIGFETHWGLGAKTRGVKWEEIEWTTEESWVEWVEREVEEEYEEEVEEEETEEVEEDGKQDEQAQEGGDDEASTSPRAPRPKRTRTLTRTRTERVPITHRRPVSKSVHALSPDQLEIFVDEGAWGLTDTAMAAQVAAESSSTSPASSRNVTRSSHSTRFPDLFARDAAHGDAEEEEEEQGETRTLHLVLYKPSSEHTPLIYLPEADGDDEAQQQHAKTAAAVAQEADPVHWGWTVPGWGGVVIYNGVERARERGEEAAASSGLLMHTPSREDQQDILDLWGRQVRSLLGLNLPQHDDDDHHAARLAHFHLLRRTLLARVSSSLESLSALSRVLTRLPSLEVGSGVQESVRLALQALEELDDAARSPSPRTLRSLFPIAARAERHAGEAFHHHRMVGLLYFPAEHTWAVYTPLFGPLVVPLVLAGGRELKGWMKRRRRRRARGAKRRTTDR